MPNVLVVRLVALVNRRSAFAALALSLSAAACDGAPTAAQPSLAVSRGSVPVGVIPTRAEEAHAAGAVHWSERSDSALWSAAAETDTTFIVGLKAPGAARGIWRGEWLVSALQVRQGQAELGRLAGVTIVRVDSVAPAVHVKVEGATRLAVLRQLPFVDYVEPAWARAVYASTWPGCADDTYAGPWTNYPGYWDIISPVLTRHYVEQAWRYSTGDGVMLGLTDTGVDVASGSEFRYDAFATGASYGRQHLLAWTQPSGGYFEPPVECDHGTNLAGIMSAPLNGNSVVGIAYRSSLVSVQQDNDVWPDHVPAAYAIDEAVRAGAKVVNMSWGLLTWYDDIADRIATYANSPYDVLFVGAAGTGTTGDGGQVMFPASHYLVLAVSASADDGTRPSSAHYGPKVELVAYTEGPTTGLNRRYPYDPLDKVGGTSAATAVVSGIAALIRSRHPTSNAAAVRNRLTSSAGPICGMPPAWMPLVNAVAAVGGICFDRRVLGPSSVNNFYAWAGTTVALSAQASGGAGPLRYEWSNGTIGPQTSVYMRRGSYDTTFTVTVVDQATNAYVTSEVHHITSRMEPYTARIDGPSEVPPWSYGCLWTSATTLPSPAVYQWTVDGAPVGDGSEFLRYAPGGSSFTIGLSITDSDGTVVYASRYVSTSTYAAACQDS